jgi:uncharacterized membrane protein
MKTLVGAVLAFLFLHRVVSAGSLRPALVGALGERRFRLLFSVASAACLAWLWIGYREARSSISTSFYEPPELLATMLTPIQLIACILIVCGLSTASPTAAGSEMTVRGTNVVQGALRITRHPFLWGVSLLSVTCMAIAPNIASWGFFGTLLGLSVMGTMSIDAKRRRRFGRAWLKFEHSTSNVPMRAILQGRQHFCLPEIGWKRAAIGACIFAGLLSSRLYLAP